MPTVEIAAVERCTEPYPRNADGRCRGRVFRDGKCFQHSEQRKHERIAFRSAREKIKQDHKAATRRVASATERLLRALDNLDASAVDVLPLDVRLLLGEWKATRTMRHAAEAELNFAGVPQRHRAARIIGDT